MRTKMMIAMLLITLATLGQSVIQIGEQFWMKENLNVGVSIPTSQPQANNGIVEKYCYMNIEKNCVSGGGLYQWDELMQYANATSSQGICPDGFRIPTKEDFMQLAEYLKGSHDETSWVGGKYFYNTSAIPLKAVHPAWRIGVTRNGVFIPTKDPVVVVPGGEIGGIPITATNATEWNAIPTGWIGTNGVSGCGPDGFGYYPYGFVCQYWTSSKVQGFEFPPNKDTFWWPVYWQIQAFNNGLSPSMGLPKTAMTVRCIKN